MDEALAAVEETKQFYANICAIAAQGQMNFAIC